MYAEMNPTDLRILAMLVQGPRTALMLARITKREYTYIMQRLMLLKDAGLIHIPRTSKYRTRRNIYVVPNNKQKEVTKLISEESRKYEA